MYDMLVAWQCKATYAPVQSLAKLLLPASGSAR
jgi:hypothetical protein